MTVLVLLAAGCPAPHPATLAGEPELRVGLATGAPGAKLGGDGELFVTDDRDARPVAAIPAGQVWSVLPDGNGLVLVKPDGSRTERHDGISAVNVTENRFAAFNGHRYRGRVNIFRAPAGLTVMNRVPLESYVASVAGQEIGPRRGPERAAVLAQAIVSRTYAVRNRGRWESEGFDATDDTRDQVYLGVAAERPEVWDAVRSTAGWIVTWHGQPIDAYFHSTCGGRTAAVTEAFRTAQDRPYLKSVSDARPGGGTWCDASPRFRWREEWDGQKLRAILTRTLQSYVETGGSGLAAITDVQVRHTSGSGRARELRVAFTRGAVDIPAADIRGVLRPEADRMLQSTAFRLFVTREGAAVSRLIAEGQGSGHGVGLCQWGAIGRARAGQDYKKILAAYYPGTTVARLY